MRPVSALLPSGFVDMLPPDAWRERKLRSTVLERFRSFGYEEVTPPLLEFEDSLLADADSKLDRQTFRVMDATSQRMMGLRADMTPQIARIAASRMQNKPLPVRLCYAGTCLRVRGEGIFKSRQLVQAGVECIGADGENILLEVLRCAQEALAQLGITDATVDITLPGLLSHLLATLPEAQRASTREAIQQKDRHRINQLPAPLNDTLLMLIDGATVEGMQSLQHLFPMETQDWLKAIERLIDDLDGFSLTLDPLEEGGFGYYDGIAFSIFSRSLGVEIGRGGRYIAHNNLPACGFTLYLTPLIRSSTLVDETPRCLVLAGANEDTARNLREKGWHTLYATAKTPTEAVEEAKRLRCTHLLEKEEVKNV